MNQFSHPKSLDFEPHPRDIARFLEKVTVDPVTGCWNWTDAYTDKDGYGQFWYDGRMHWSHRWSWAVWRRPLIKGLTVEHECTNSSCCNPWHLKLLTHAVNSARRHRHGMGSAGVPF